MGNDPVKGSRLTDPRPANPHDLDTESTHTPTNGSSVIVDSGTRDRPATERPTATPTPIHGDRLVLLSEAEKMEAACRNLLERLARGERAGNKEQLLSDIRVLQYFVNRVLPESIAEKYRECRERIFDFFVEQGTNKGYAAFIVKTFLKSKIPEEPAKGIAGLSELLAKGLDDFS